MPTPDGPARPAPVLGAPTGRVRLYQTLRTAHLEQALQLAPATILYRARRYDFDEDLAARLDLVRAGPLRAAWLLLRSPVDEFEINEPLMRYAVRGTALAVAAVRLRSLLTRRRTTIVTYAIENCDPYALRRPRGWRALLRRAVDRRLSGAVWRSVDRVVFGTAAARDVYRARLSPPRPAEVLLPALPQPCPTCAPAPPDGKRVVFLGALSERKGVPLLMAAWPLVRQRFPDARLTVVGQGALEDAVREWAAGDGSVELVVDPPRARIHEVLRRAAVLVLPSQPQPAWREQLGLPLTEALSHGVPVVTTTETGLADWLAEHGHGVVDSPGTPATLADAVVARLRDAPSRDSVLAALPARDGRLAADDWLFAPRPDQPAAGAAASARRWRRSRRTYQR